MINERESVRNFRLFYILIFSKLLIFFQIFDIFLNFISLFQRKRKRKLEDDGDTISLQSFDSAGKVIVCCLSVYVCVPARKVLVLIALSNNEGLDKPAHMQEPSLLMRQSLEAEEGSDQNLDV